MSSFRSRLFVAIMVSLVRIGIVTFIASISVDIAYGTNSSAALLLAFCGRERFEESGNTPQTIEKFSYREVDDILQGLLACEEGRHAQLEAMAV
jgi:hypothetical protein